VSTTAINPDVLKRITYSKYLLGRAYEHWQQGGDINAAQAILLAHDSAEMLMRAIADHEHVRLSDGFLIFWDEIKKKTGKSRRTRARWIVSTTFAVHSSTKESFQTRP
jgi:hypothetical protein